MAVDYGQHAQGMLSSHHSFSCTSFLLSLASSMKCSHFIIINWKASVSTNFFLLLFLTPPLFGRHFCFFLFFLFLNTIFNFILMKFQKGKTKSVLNARLREKMSLFLFALILLYIVREYLIRLTGRITVKILMF